jgi:hypothetical protein
VKVASYITIPQAFPAFSGSRGKWLGFSPALEIGCRIRERALRRAAEFRAHNSAVECVLHTDEVAGSIPAAPTPKSGFSALSRFSLSARKAPQRDHG